MARPRYFTPEEVAAIIKFFVDRGDQWMADMVKPGCKNGLRRMEIVNLAKGNIPLSSCGRFAVVVPKYTKNKLERSVPIDSCKEAVLGLMESIPESLVPPDILSPLVAPETRHGSSRPAFRFSLLQSYNRNSYKQ